jgi:hypothetical protein
MISTHHNYKQTALGCLKKRRILTIKTSNGLRFTIFRILQKAARYLV